MIYVNTDIAFYNLKKSIINWAENTKLPLMGYQDHFSIMIAYK